MSIWMSVSDPEPIWIPPADFENHVFLHYSVRLNDNIDDDSVGTGNDDSDVEEINHQDLLLTTRYKSFCMQEFYCVDK